MKSGLALGAALLAVIAGASCGENLTAVPTGPTGPVSLSPLLMPRVDGVWTGTLTLTDITGGTGPSRSAGELECVGAEFAAVLNSSNDHTLSITQTGTTLTGRLTSSETGLACTYNGRVGSNTLVLDAATCDAPVLLLRCQPDAAGVVRVRQMNLVGSSITATLDAPVSVTSVSGWAAHTYNVTGAEGDVGGLVARHRFDNLTRR